MKHVLLSTTIVLGLFWVTILVGMMQHQNYAFDRYDAGYNRIDSPLRHPRSSEEWLRSSSVLTSRQQSKSTSTSTPPRCLGLDVNGDMDQLLARYKQIFVITEAKAAGTTFKHFTANCMRDNQSFLQVDNILMKPGPMLEAFMGPTLELPRLISSHVTRAEEIVHFSKHVTDESLIIYTHRQGTEKRLSAIRHVCAKRICAETGFPCTIPEKDLVDTISQQAHEIGASDSRTLTCEAYESIRDNAPNMVVMDYTQADKMVDLLAKHLCPGENDKTESVNIGTDNGKVLVELKVPKKKRKIHKDITPVTVDLDDWLQAKKQMVELVTRIKQDSTCQGTTKKLEHDLSSCPDKTVHFSSSTDFFD